MKAEVAELLEESRNREKGQTLFYRALAARAEEDGEAQAAERLNALLADEQHHLARLTARILESERSPLAHELPAPSRPSLEGWEEEAREREEGEVAWYREALGGAMDAQTRELLEEILASEEHHARELGGKWMSA
jgi:rubrerythrin